MFHNVSNRTCPSIRPSIHIHHWFCSKYCDWSIHIKASYFIHFNTIFSLRKDAINPTVSALCYYNDMSNYTHIIITMDSDCLLKYKSAFFITVHFLYFFKINFFKDPVEASETSTCPIKMSTSLIYELLAHWWQ